MTEDRPQLPPGPGGITGAFLENKGQFDPLILYIMRQRGVTTVFFQNGMVLGLIATGWGALLKITYLGLNPLSRPQGEEPLEDNLCFFESAQLEQLYPGLPRWGMLFQENVWEGIDLAIRPRERGFKIDWIVHPGADPAAIRILWEGSGPLSVNEAGELVIPHPMGELRELSPYCYQKTEEGVVEINCRHVVEGAVSGFAAEGYDPKLPLVIDPPFVCRIYTDGEWRI